MSEIEARCREKGLVWVGGDGVRDAKLCIVGEAPGREEVEHKNEKGELDPKPFVGGAGRLLDSIISRAGSARAEIYVTNVVKVRPPENKIERLVELGLSVSDFLPLLKSELESIKPNCILALGETALEVLTNLKPISKWRGSIVESSLVSGQKIVATYHPAAVLWAFYGESKKESLRKKAKEIRVLIEIDIKRAVEESKSSEINTPKRELIIEPGFEKALELIREVTVHRGKAAFDLEIDIYGLISCLSASIDPARAFCIPLRKGHGSYWSEGEESVIWRELEKMFRSEKLWMVMYAIGMDLPLLVPKVGYFEIYMDIMWAMQTCYAELPKGLDTIDSLFTREPYYKDERKVWKDLSMTKQLWIYNNKDSATTLESGLALEKELESLHMREFFFGYVMKLLPVLLKMQFRGMRVDPKIKDEIAKELRARQEVLEKEFGEVNVRSPKQLATLLYDQLGFKKQFSKKTGSVTTDRAALIKLRKKEE
jgi:DNA polymerase